MNDASILAESDERWSVVDDEWYACIEEAGFVADRDSMGPVIPDDAEGAIRAAVAEATCSQAVDRIQRLANIEAQYQAALIDEQQTALNESLAEQERILNEARSLVEERP